MYTQECKKKSEIIETKPSPEEEEQEDKITSPVLSRKTRNPFAKSADGCSPSLLTRTRRRTRLNIFTPTVIDSTVIEQSKFFAKSSTSDLNEYEVKSEITNSSETNEIQKQMQIEGKENIDKNHQIINHENKEEDKTEILRKYSKDPPQELNINNKELLSDERNYLPISSENQSFPENLENDCQENTLDRSIGISSIKITSELESQMEGQSSNCLMESESSSFMDTGELLNDLQSQRCASPDSEFEYSVEASSIETIRTGLFQWSNTKTLGVKKMASQHKSKEVIFHF